jgi:hypothetical protein
VAGGEEGKSVGSIVGSIVEKGARDDGADDDDDDDAARTLVGADGRIVVKDIITCADYGAD